MRPHSAQIILVGLCLLIAAGRSPSAERKLMDAGKYHFDGAISREVLENYLSRAITQLGLNESRQREDDIRMLGNVGAKFIGRAAYLWGNPGDDEAYFKGVKETADLAHKADPDMILQGCIFEAIYQGVDDLPIPSWVFEEFGLKPQKRNFRYEAMLYGDGRLRDFWTPGGSVPDMSKLETRMWFFYRARRYIDSGFEAIHFGQVHLMDQNDPEHRYWLDILGRIRRYAKAQARRHLVLCDAHTHGIAHDGKLMFDFHAYPLRIAEVESEPEKGVLRMGYIDSIYGKSMGGIAPSGWTCEHLPYLVEIDNWGSSGKGGQRIGGCWIWGYDEISWFARQPESYRNEWLRYADKWVRENDPNGHLQMPGQRCVSDMPNGIGTYSCNTQSKAAPQGFNQEETIKAIWSEVPGKEREMSNPPVIKKVGTIECDMVEATPIVFKGKRYLFEYVRTDHKHNHTGDSYFQFMDVKSGAATSGFAKGAHLGSAHVECDTVYAYGVNKWGGDTIYEYSSKDMQTWTSGVALHLPGWEIFNNSVCKGPDGYVMSFEIGKPEEETGVPFTLRFATSKDLLHWTLTPSECVYSKDRYTACPVIRFLDGNYYMIYLEAYPGPTYVPHIARSRDLIHWESSPFNPIMKFNDEEDKRIANPRLTTEERERIAKALDINNSDVDLCEFEGKTHIVYSWGNQQGNEFLAEAVYDGSLKDFFHGYFPGK